MTKLVVLKLIERLNSNELSAKFLVKLHYKYANGVSPKYLGSLSISHYGFFDFITDLVTCAVQQGQDWLILKKQFDLTDLDLDTIERNLKILYLSE